VFFYLSIGSAYRRYGLRTTPYYPYGDYVYYDADGYYYPGQTAPVSYTIYNTNAPTYSQEENAYAPEKEAPNYDPERADRYIRDLTDENPAVRKVAVIVLAEIGAEEAEGLLIDVMLTDTDAGVRRAAAEALGNIGSVRAVDPLHRAKQDEDKNVRLAAQKSLAKLRKLWAR
jgi:hypothetical protein